MQKKEKEEFAREIEEQCQTLIEENQAKQMTLEEGISFAMSRTREMKKEVGFAYDPITQQLTSRIVEGSQKCVYRPLELQFAKAFFHTHPTLPHKKCEFSLEDVEDLPDIRFSNIQEIKVGCPLNDEVITLSYTPTLFDRFLLRVSALTGDKLCYGELVHTVDELVEKIKVQYPVLSSEIDKIKEEYNEETLLYMKEGIIRDYERLQEHLIEKVVKKREKWKK